MRPTDRKRLLLLGIGPTAERRQKLHGVLVRVCLPIAEKKKQARNGAVEILTK